MAGWRDYIEDFAQYCTDGYNLLCYYREDGVTDIPIDEWYQKRLGEEGFALWKSMRFQRNKKGLHLYLGDNLITVFDVSDEHYNQLSIPERKEFERKEIFRRRYGYWVDLPSFGRLSEETKRRKLKESKFAGRVQLLSGSDYFKLNYLRLVDTESQDVISLDYIRKSAQFLEILEVLSRYSTNNKDRQGILVFKPRAVKFTSDVNAFFINNLLMPAAYQVNSTIDKGMKVPDTMQEKVSMPMSQCPKWLLNKYKAEKESQAVDNSILRLVSTGENGEIIKNTYKIRSAKPTGFEQDRANAYYADEISLYEYSITSILSKARATLKNKTSNVVGLFIGGGTSDSNNANIEKLKTMAFSPKTHSIFTYFIGIQYHKDIDEETGYANSEKIVKELMAKREEISRHSDTEELIQHCTVNALSINDCFYVKGATQIDVIRIGNQIHNITSKTLNGDFNLHRGWLHPTWKELQSDSSKYTVNDIMNPEFKPDPKGGWFIAENPDKNLNKGKPELFYCAGADNFNKTLLDDEALKVNEGNLKRSKLAMVVLKRHTKSPTAMYLYRHADPKEDYYQTMLGCLFYNCYMFPETNKENHADFFGIRGDRIFGLIQSGRFANYLYPTPARFRKKRTGWQVGMDTGQDKNSLYQEHIVPYFDKYTEDIYIERLLSACARWDIDNKKNTPDEGMALLMALIGLDDIERTATQRSGAYKMGAINPYDYLQKTYIGQRNRI